MRPRRPGADAGALVGDKLRRVIDNVVKNAIEAVDCGSGRVDVRAHVAV